MPGPTLRTDARATLPATSAVPAGDRGAAQRERAAAHLRGPLPPHDRALPCGRSRIERVPVRHRVAFRGGAQAHRMRLRDRQSARAHARRPPEHPRARHASLPPDRTPGRPALPGGRDRVPRRGGRASPTPKRRPGRARALRASSSSRPPTSSSSEDELARDGRLPDGRRRSSSGSAPSRSCSSCAPKTPACACSRCCSAPRSSASSWSTARRRARAPTARSASAEASGPAY